MGAIKKVAKKATGAVSGVVKGVTGMLGLGGQDINMPEIKTPAQQLARESEVGAEDIQSGVDDESGIAAKGKRALLRPASTSSLGGMR